MDLIHTCQSSLADTPRLPRAGLQQNPRVLSLLRLLEVGLCLWRRSMRQAEKLLGLLQEMASQIDIYGKVSRSTVGEA